MCLDLTDVRFVVFPGVLECQCSRLSSVLDYQTVPLNNHNLAAMSSLGQQSNNCSW